MIKLTKQKKIKLPHEILFQEYNQIRVKYSIMGKVSKKKYYKAVDAILLDRNIDLLYNITALDEADVNKLIANYNIVFMTIQKKNMQIAIIPWWDKYDKIFKITKVGLV